MPTTADQIEALLGVRSEDEHLEFKEATSNFHFEELVDYCVALANEGGGRMLLGNTDKMPRRVTGTKVLGVPERTVATVSQIIAATVDAGKIKVADPSQTSTRYRNYVRFWA